MKILYHHRTQGRGVEGVHIRGMINAFRRLGHEVITVSPPGIDPLDESKNSSWRTFAAKMPEIIFELSELLYNFWAYKKMADIVKKESIDFIYERYALNTFAGLNISKRHKIPLILEVNDAAGIERVRALKIRGLAGRIEKHVFSGASAIATISSYFKKFITDGGVPEGKVFVIPNAVDEKGFSGTQNDSRDIRSKYSLGGKTVIGYVGSFLRWHGVDLLLESFASASGRNPDARLLLVGDGLKFNEIKEMAGGNGLKDVTVFTGKVAHTEIPSYIRAMDVCVIPDSNLYGSPMKLFEYMASGKPVVAPRLMPMEDVVKDGVNGVLFEAGNSDELGRALGRLIKDPGRRNSIGESAKRTVLERHTWARNAEKVLEIYGAAKWN